MFLRINLAENVCSIAWSLFVILSLKVLFDNVGCLIFSTYIDYGIFQLNRSINITLLVTSFYKFDLSTNHTWWQIEISTCDPQIDYLNPGNFLIFFKYRKESDHVLMIQAAHHVVFVRNQYYKRKKRTSKCPDPFIQSKLQRVFNDSNQWT